MVTGVRRGVMNVDQNTLFCAISRDRVYGPAMYVILVNITVLLTNLRRGIQLFMLPYEDNYTKKTNSRGIRMLTLPYKDSCTTNPLRGIHIMYYLFQLKHVGKRNVYLNFIK